jgi:O-antigen ligase
MIVAAVPLFWTALWWTGQRPVPRTPLDSALILLVSVLAMSTIITPSLEVSLGKLSSVALGLLLFWALVQWTAERDRFVTALWGFVAGGTALALLGLFGTKVYSRFPLIETVALRIPQLIQGVPSAESGFNPNAVAGALTLFIPLQAALLTGWKEQNRLSTAIQVVLLLLTLGTAIIMQSRGAWVGLVVAALALLIWHSRQSRIIVAVCLAVGAAALLVSGPVQQFDRVLGRPGATMEATYTARQDLWSLALCGIRHEPILGYGLNVFRTHRPDACATERYDSREDIIHVHNNVLQTTLDLGLVGVAAYLWLWALLLNTLRRVHLQAGTGMVAATARGLGAGFLAYFVFGLTDAIPLGAKVGIFFWFAAALTVGLARVAACDASQFNRDRGAATSPR